MAHKDHINRVFRGGAVHNAVSLSHTGTRTSSAPLRWRSKSIDPVGEHAALCATELADYLYEVVLDAGQLVVCGAHAHSVLASVDYRMDVTEFENAELNRIKYEIELGDLVATLNEGRKSFHRRVGYLQSHRLPPSVVDTILSGGAYDVDYQDYAVNRVLSHVMRHINGNPFNVVPDDGVSKQAALMYLYLGHVVDRD